MSRDDSNSYTGLRSVAADRIRKERVTRANVKEQRKAEAFKNGELILDQLTKDEADLVTRVFSLIDNADKEEDVRAKLLALRLERERIRIHRANFEYLLKGTRSE
jgi:hypothetical protein